MATEETTSVDYKGRSYPALYTPPTSCPGNGCAVVLTHGAGGDLHLPQLSAIAEALARAGYLCLRFTCKGLNITHRTNVYMAAVDHMLLESRGKQLKGIFLAGRSMGSRAAVAAVNSLAASGAPYDSLLKGVLCFAYPLHRPKDRTNLRDGPLLDLKLPCLLVSGTRDDMCHREQFLPLLDQRELLEVCWVHDGDHSFKVAGRSEAAVVDEFMNTVIEWLRKHAPSRPRVTKNMPKDGGKKGRLPKRKGSVGEHTVRKKGKTS